MPGLDLIDINSSIKNVTDKSKKIHPDTAGGDRALLWFRKTFCYNWVKLHKKWPELAIVGPIPGNMHLSMSEGTWLEHPAAPWSLMDFKNIHIKRNLDFNWQLDPTEMLSDKAIACGLTSWLRE